MAATTTPCPVTILPHPSARSSIRRRRRSASRVAFLPTTPPRTPATGSVTAVLGEALASPTLTYSDASGTTTATAPVNAGVYTVTASYAGNANYNAASATAAITILPAPLTVTTNSSIMLVGNNPPPLTGSVNGTPFTGS